MKNDKTLEKEAPTPSPETLEKVEALLKRVQKSKGGDDAAAKEIVAMGYEGGCAIYHVLKSSKELETPRKRRRALAAICIVGGIASALNMYLHKDVTLVIAMAAFFLLGLHQIVTAEGMTSSLFARGARLSLSIEDLRMTPIILAYCEEEPTLRRYATVRVGGLLEQISQEDEIIISYRHLRTLCSMAAAYTGREKADPNWLDLVQPCAAIFRSLRYIGDAESLKEAILYAESAKEGAIKTAALETLPLLEARIQRMGLDLLRASQAPAEASQTLLRPATAAPPEPAEQLLRASDEER